MPDETRALTLKPMSVVGPPLAENRVIVEGRVIPRLTCHENGETLDLILDGRFSLTVKTEDAYPIAHMIATALAIGEGYPSLAAAGKERPFAPQAAYIGSLDDVRG